ncbi:S41 family peptidase [Lactococcus petauri]|uniref:S41 family peptidase n=1 Tax=Lactococcus petauri TaxID=1940789 RepID=UPI0022E410FC|nr:S41 family peptidase [Lactococcus petauri]
MIVKHLITLILESSLHKNNYNGVIVDLRGNRGGDLSPMVLGLSPLLPDGTLFNYVDKSSHSKPVELQNGEINSGGSSTKISDNKKIKKAPIAVLIDNNTGSSGELTALCFEGIPNVKFFGSDSAGYTSVFVKDRTNNIYKNFPISPDIQTNNAKSSAIEWIKSQIK